MFNVSESFKLAAKQPVQEHKITGTIGSVSFSETNIVEGSFSITNQSTDTNDVVLGSCYVGQLTAEFIGINIAWGKWINKTITPTFQLKIDENTWESVPLGIYKIKEAKHTERGVQVTAYDNMIKFDKKFKKSHFMNLSGMTNIIDQLCTDAGVILGMSYADIEALPNGDRTGINIYGSKGKKAEFANDITTLRDLLFWVAQTLGCFATMNRAGQLEFRPYTQTVVDRISEHNRIEGATFADYVTHYVGIYVVNLDDNTEDYYGYDVTALTEERNETLSEITADNELIAGYIEDLVEWDEKLANHECTQQEYDAAVAEITAAMNPLKLEVKQLAKRLDWLNNAIEQAADDGSDMVLGANPLVMAKSLVTRDSQRREILGALDGITYTPFQASVVCGCIYDLGDVIQFSGGLYNSENDCFGCVMSYTYTHNGGTELEGFGVDPSVVVVRNKTQKSVDRSSRNSVDATHNQVGAADPTTGGGGGGGSDAVPGKNGDIYITTNSGNISDEVLYSNDYTTSSTPNNPISVTNFSGDNDSGFGFTITGYPNARGEGENVYFGLNGLDDGKQYKIEFDAQFTRADGGWEWTSYQDFVSHNDMRINLSSDFSVHSYEGIFTYSASSRILYFMFPRVNDNKTFSINFSNIKFSPYGDNGVKKVSYYSESDKQWHNIDYVQKVTQTQTSGTEIAEVQNSDGTKTKLYQKDGGLVDDVKVDDVSVVTNKIANIYTMSGATAGAAGTKGLVPAPASGDNEKFLRGDGTWQEVQGGGGGGSIAGNNIYTEKVLWQSANGTSSYTTIELSDQISKYDAIYIVTASNAEPTFRNSQIIPVSAIDKSGNTHFGVFDTGANTYYYSVLTYVDETHLILGEWGSAYHILYYKIVGINFGTQSPIIYSLEEREVGVWTDGKPLYQKTIYPASNVNTSNNAWSTVSWNDEPTNIEHLVAAEFVGNANTETIIPNNQGVFRFCINSGHIKVASLNTYVLSTNDRITFFYTKTTDVAGSGKYAELGVPAVHYDDTERVIGTYFGKPLYRKAWTGQSIFLGWQGGSAANYTTGTWQNSDVQNIKLLVNLKLTTTTGICDTPAGVKSASTTISLFSKVQETYDTIILEYTKTTD